MPFEKYLVEEKRTRISPEGRQLVEYVATGEEVLGVTSIISPHEAEKWRALKLTVDTVIAQRLGHVKAKVGDRLVKGDEVYLVQAVKNIAGLGQWYLYFTQRRCDVR